MAGIFGFVARTKTLEEQKLIAATMARELSFRGDIELSFRPNEAALLVARHFLHENMLPGFSDPECVVVLEGEIYNREQLAEELNIAGFAGDAEIVAAAYKKHGIDFARGINGVFGIALYDYNNSLLILARDHVGSRNLFYAQNMSGIFFSTTIKSLLKTGVIDNSLSISSIQTYFSSTAVSPPSTMFSHVRCLPPGAVVVFKKFKEKKEHIYWNIAGIQEDYSRTIEDFSEELRELIIDAVKVRSRAGGIYGSIVSGGLDSSVVTALLAKNFDNHGKLPVFSINFDEKAYSDAPLQKIMYDSFDLQPHNAVITAQEYWEILQTAVSHLDNPVNDDAVVGMYRVFKLARSKGCTVLFEGEAADELFFTGHVHAERQFQKYTKIPYVLRRCLIAPLFSSMILGTGKEKKIMRFLFRLGLSDTERRLLVLPSFYRTSRTLVRNDLFQIDKDPLQIARSYLSETQLKDPLNIYYYGLIKNFLPDDLLYKNERAAAANQIANRTPFIDYRLVELALKVPQYFKVRKSSKADDGTKLVYKKAVEGIIPEKIRCRKKTRGFSIPSSAWYLDQLKEEVHDLLFSSKSLYTSYLQSGYVGDIYRKHLRDVTAYHYLITSIVIFELWCQSNILSK